MQSVKYRKTVEHNPSKTSVRSNKAHKLRKDLRYTYISPLIRSGHVKSWLDIFNVIPKSVVAKDLGMNITHFTACMYDPLRFAFGNVEDMAEWMEIDPHLLFKWLHEQIKNGLPQPGTIIQY